MGKDEVRGNNLTACRLWRYVFHRFNLMQGIDNQSRSGLEGVTAALGFRLQGEKDGDGWQR
jgi:hypothetical protein